MGQDDLVPFSTLDEAVEFNRHRLYKKILEVRHVRFSGGGGG